jgi:pyruvate ferredoxin oxidoreductase gamma subunit
MLQVRIHGRGGQGVVTAAEVLSIAAFLDGKYSQAIPSFGSERMGAPVMAYCRIHDREIRSREPVMEPDALIIQDPTLLHQVDLFAGLAKTGYVLVNSTRTLSELGIEEYLSKLPEGHVYAIPATDVALKHIRRPLPNAVLIGGFAAMTDSLRLTSVLGGIRQKFSGRIGEANAAAAEEAYHLVRSQTEQPRGVKQNARTN